MQTEGACLPRQPAWPWEAEPYRLWSLLELICVKVRRQVRRGLKLP